MLDIKTLLFAMFLSMVLGTLALFFFALINRQTNALWFWCLSQLSAAVGAVFFMLRGVIPEAISILVGNTLVFGSFPLAIIGMWVFFGSGLRKIRYLVLIWLIFVAVLSWYTFIDYSFPARAVTSAVIFFIMSMTIAFVLWGHSRKTNLSGMGLGWFYFLHSFGYLIRIPGILGAEVGDLFNNLVTDQIFYSEGIMAGVLAPLGYILMVNERLLKEIQQQASVDPLTGLLNRRAFYTTVEPALANCMRTKKPVSVVILDIDHFKQVNDQHGHQIGDEILVLAAECFRDQLRGGDIAARYGGEEFLIFLPETDRKQAVEVAERLRLSYKQQVSERDQDPTLSSISLGVVSAIPQNGDIDELINQADTLLYRAKETGRDNVQS